MPSAEIITIGTEILLGEIVDTNTRHIARTLRAMGVDLFRTITIGDNVERIADAIRHSMERAEIVITTGGLGPTVDDPTREAVARAAGVELEFREDLWEQVVGIISRYGRKASENQRRQAYIPKGAIAISNPVGTAPCFIVESSPLPMGDGLGARKAQSFRCRAFRTRWNTSCTNRSFPIFKNDTTWTRSSRYVCCIARAWGKD